MLDLGAGTGLLSYYWYEQCSSAEYMLVDIAEEMLDVSRKRFSGLHNIHHRIVLLDNKGIDSKEENL